MTWSWKELVIMNDVNSHDFFNSVLLFNWTFRSAKVTTIIYVTNKSHFLGSYMCMRKILYSILNGNLSLLFNFHRYWDSSTSIMWSLCLEDFVWLLDLGLNSNFVSWYSLLVVLVVISAFHTIYFCSYLLFEGQFSLFAVAWSLNFI